MIGVLIRNSTREFAEFCILSSVADGMEDRHFSVEEHGARIPKSCTCDRNSTPRCHKVTSPKKMSFRSIILSRKRPTNRHTQAHYVLNSRTVSTDSKFCLCCWPFQKGNWNKKGGRWVLDTRTPFVKCSKRGGGARTRRVVVRRGFRAAAMSGNAPSCTRRDPVMGGREYFLKRKTWTRWKDTREKWQLWGRG